MAHGIRGHVGIRATIATVAAVAVLAGGVGAALAHTTGFPSSLTLSRSAVDHGVAGFDSKWYGAVDSPKAACKPHRTVRLYKKDSAAATPVFLAETKSSADPAVGVGSYAIYTDGSPPKPGYYFTRVTRKDIGPPGHHHICRAARSNEYFEPSS